jgi:hypothetical protein
VLWVVIVLGAIVLVVVLILVALYNRLVRLRNRAETPGPRSTCSFAGATT